MKNEISFLQALTETLNVGNERHTRNGLTKAIFAYQMRFNLQEGFPLVTTKKLNWKSIVAELLWFIDAGKETRYRLSLQKLNEIQGKPLDAPNIWSLNQSQFAAKDKAQFEGDCGRIYGAQWRNWKYQKWHLPYESMHSDDQGTMMPGYSSDENIDQLANVINQLKNDPYSRYHVINAWNPGEIDDMCLPPCHMKMQFFVRQEGLFKYLDLSMDQRSCDMFLGVPFNIASYALLLHMVAQCVGMLPGELVVTLNDCHIYLADIKTNGQLDYEKGHKPQVELQLSRPPYDSPSIKLNPLITNIDDFTMNDIEILNYQHHAFIKGDLL